MPTKPMKTAAPAATVIARPFARLPAPLRYRLAVFSRVIAAVAGGYALATAATAFLALARIDLLTRVDAVLTATLLGLAAYAGATLWVFAAPTAGRAWAGVAAPALVFGGLAWLMRSGGVL